MGRQSGRAIPHQSIGAPPAGHHPVALGRSGQDGPPWRRRAKGGQGSGAMLVPKSRSGRECPKTNSA